MSDVAIAAKGLGKRYRGRWALADCSFEVPTGKVCGLVGANGAGKSTLIRILAGLSTPSAGSAEVGGLAPADRTGFLRTVGYLAQDITLSERWTADDHLRMGRAMNVEWDRETPRGRLRSLDIPLDRRIEHLSGGMRAQVALAVAMSKRPDVLLLDEPVAALDPLARREVLSSLAVAMAEGPLTVLISSHLLSDLERICDHLVVLSKGRPALTGDVEDLLRQHKQVTVPVDSLATVRRQHDVITEDRDHGQAHVFVRLTAPVLDPDWQVRDVTLEDVVLAYLGRDREARPSRPVAAVEVVR